MIPRRSLLALVIAGSLAACISVDSSAIDMNVEAVPNFDFSPMRRFTWLAPTADPWVNSTVLDKVAGIADAELQARGFERTAGTPDFLVSLHVGVEHTSEKFDWGVKYARQSDIGSMRREIEVTERREATLVLVVVDPASERPVWRGVARGAVRQDVSEAERATRVRGVVARLLDRFPPR